jgi:hypothetical protein
MDMCGSGASPRLGGRRARSVSNVEARLVALQTRYDARSSPVGFARRPLHLGAEAEQSAWERSVAVTCATAGHLSRASVHAAQSRAMRGSPRRPARAEGERARGRWRPSLNMKRWCKVLSTGADSAFGPGLEAVFEMMAEASHRLFIVREGYIARRSFAMGGRVCRLSKLTRNHA